MDSHTIQTATNPPRGILAQVRSEARKQERQHIDYHIRQIAEAEYEDALELGRNEGRQEAPSRLTWFGVGVASTIITSILIIQYLGLN